MFPATAALFLALALLPRSTCGFAPPAVLRTSSLSPSSSSGELSVSPHLRTSTTLRLPATFLSGSKRGGGGGGAASRRKKRKKKGSDASSSSSSSGGFGKQDDSPPEGTGGGESGVEGGGGGEGGGRSIYSLPALYDLAFGYRNYDEEVRFLLHAHRTHSTGGRRGRGPDGDDDDAEGRRGGEEEEEEEDCGIRVLELAAGPARHSLAALSDPDARVRSATAVDLCPDMVEYGNENADLELGNDGPRREAFRYVLGDMRTFDSSDDGKEEGEEEEEESDAAAAAAVAGPFDTAWILLGSMQHLTTNSDVVSCFESVARSLRPGGTLVLELPHPRETFSMVECTRNGWEVPLEDEDGRQCGELRVVWGDEDDPFDPIRQVRDFTVAMELTGMDREDEKEDGELRSVREAVPMRLFTAQEIDALGRCVGLEVAGMYGALALIEDQDDGAEDPHPTAASTVGVNDEDEAFRLVCVLRKPLQR